MWRYDLNPKKIEAPWLLTKCLAIAFITTEFANGRVGIGSGAFIGPDLVLTAAHNVYLAPVYDGSSRTVAIPATHARHILVQRGRWGRNTDGCHGFEEHVGTLAVMNAAFIAHHVSNYDFAIIKLATAVNSYIEHLSYQDYPSLSPGRQLRTVGFPGDLPNMFNLGLHWQHPDDGYYPYESVGKELRASTEHVLRHSMQTAPGKEWAISIKVPDRADKIQAIPEGQFSSMAMARWLLFTVPGCPSETITKRRTSAVMVTTLRPTSRS